jgi:hypothetical protein
VNMKRSPRSSKRPVLTSPGKIGALVSLLLVFVGVSVGYYFMTFYKVRVQWLSSGSGWPGFNLRAFSGEMYPLLAAVAVVSLIGYFLVASAVRRYQFYLDSGQDYRKMISVAESIDDLTDPAQIARLSSYPELQAVLRNYGEQIREISQEIGQKEEPADYAELEAVVDGLLAGNPADGKSGGKPWESTYRKLRDRLESDRKRIHELETSGDAERAVIGRATLAYGRVMEAISGAGEDLLEITRGMTDIQSAGGQMGGAAASPVDDGAPRKAIKAVVTEMENSARKLEEGARVLGEFSEENNGIALNMAIMAAKGSVGEQDLATFADRVRGTAERFRRLNGTVMGIVEGLLASCQTLKEKLGAASPAARKTAAGPDRRVVETARKVEERANLLQERICNLGSELHEVHEMLQHDFTGAPAEAWAPHSERTAVDEEQREAPAAPEVPREECSATAACAGPEAPVIRKAEQTGASSFVIDHGKSWEGMSEGQHAEESSLEREKPIAFGGQGGEEAECGDAPRAEEPEPAKSDFTNMSSLRDLAGPDEESSEKAAGEKPAPGAEPRDESWMEMPGQRWLKINVEKPAQAGAGPVDVTVEKAAQPCGAAAEREAVTAEHPRTSAAAAAEEEEPVFDLFQLGAVEYVEEAQTRR